MSASSGRAGAGSRQGEAAGRRSLPGFTPTTWAGSCLRRQRGRRARQTPALRTSVTCADEIAVLTSSVVYDLLVRSAGWSSAQYEHWLAGRLAELIERNPDHPNKERLDDRE